MEPKSTEPWDGTEKGLEGLMAYLRGFCAEALPPGSISAEAFNAHDNKVTVHITVEPEIDPLAELRKTVEAFDKHEGDSRFFLREENRRLEILGIQICDSTGLSSEAYATDDKLSARWLLGQIRDFNKAESATQASGMLRTIRLSSWRAMAEEVLITTGGQDASSV